MLSTLQFLITFLFFHLLVCLYCNIIGGWTELFRVCFYILYCVVFHLFLSIAPPVSQALEKWFPCLTSDSFFSSISLPFFFHGCPRWSETHSCEWLDHFLSFSLVFTSNSLRFDLTFLRTDGPASKTILCVNCGVIPNPALSLLPSPSTLPFFLLTNCTLIVSSGEQGKDAFSCLLLATPNNTRSVNRPTSLYVYT